MIQKILKNKKSIQLWYDRFPGETKALPRTRDIRLNDLVLLLGLYKSSTKDLGGRVALEMFKGCMKKVALFRTTCGDYNDPKSIGWKSNKAEVLSTQILNK